MIVTQTQVRVRYGETDQMGFVYYGNYALYYEVARADAMRQMNMSYHQMEQRGVVMPIVNMSSKYIRPARYDDLLTIKTSVRQMPASRMHFHYEVYNEAGVLLNLAETTLAFIKKESGRPCAAPDWFLEKLEPLFRQNPHEVK
ncbi:MAG: thioesterase family protein [Bacteroidales bacterium]